jgi:hypothetical protein
VLKSNRLAIKIKERPRQNWCGLSCLLPGKKTKAAQNERPFAVSIGFRKIKTTGDFKMLHRKEKNSG